MQDVVFVTGNPDKAKNFSKHVGFSVAHEQLDLDEIQTLDDKKLVEHKVRQAYELLHRPVLVEDVTFSFDAWGDLPGPFVKFFVEAGRDASVMCRMLDGFKNRRATASCTFGYFNGAEVRFITSSVGGTISSGPRGAGGYGFDRIFEPDGFDGKTAAELTPENYDRYYMTMKPLAQISDFLKEKHGR